MAQTQECIKCNGNGHIPMYALHNKGKCYKCRGTGVEIMIKPRKVLPRD